MQATLKYLKVKYLNNTWKYNVNKINNHLWYYNSVINSVNIFLYLYFYQRIAYAQKTAQRIKFDKVNTFICLPCRLWNVIFPVPQKLPSCPPLPNAIITSVSLFWSFMQRESNYSLWLISLGFYEIDPCTCTK
jgi:hypothetical protein